MGRTWTAEDAARRLLSLFIGKHPGDTVHISEVSPKFVDGHGAEELLQAVAYATQQQWITFDGEQITLLPEGFAQPHELPITMAAKDPPAK